jgi:3-hydroxyisobutyrate dehydrogenase-like beta-hydroxyacid dehydrogenase
LRPGQICADLSASTPEIKKQIWEVLEPTGVLFADAAMMGLLAVNKDQVPISASGSGAQALYDALTPLGMKVTVVGDAPGAASGMKLLRSIYMKGHDALFFEMLRAAEKYGIFDEMIRNVGVSLDPFTIAQQAMAEQGTLDSNTEKAMGMVMGNMGRIALFFNLFYYMVFGAVAASITANFTKKENPFGNIGNE